MSHTSNRIYIKTDETPNKGITLDDIGTVLVRSVRDVGQLCGDVAWNETTQQWEVVNGGNGAINKWARNKPFRNSSKGFTKAEVITAGGACDSARASANYGLVVCQNTTASTKVYGPFTDFGGFTSTSGTSIQVTQTGNDKFLYQLITGHATWEYNRPRGLATYNEMYRALDFHNYYSTAKNPFPVPIEREGTWYVPAQLKRANISVIINTIQDGSIALSELHAVVGDVYAGDALENYYPGIVIYYIHNGVYYAHYKTAEHPLTSYPLADEIIIPIDGIEAVPSNEGWYARTFFSSIEIEQDSVIDEQGEYVPCDSPVRQYTFAETSGKVEVSYYSIKVMNASGTGDLRVIVKFMNESGNTASVANALLTIQGQVGSIPLHEDSSNTVEGSYNSLQEKTFSTILRGFYDVGTAFTITADVEPQYGDEYTINVADTIKQG